MLVRAGELFDERLLFLLGLGGFFFSSDGCLFLRFLGLLGLPLLQVRDVEALALELLDDFFEDLVALVDLLAVLQLVEPLRDLFFHPLAENVGRLREPSRTLSRCASSLQAMAHLFARYREIFPLSFTFAWVMKGELKRWPYFGVVPPFFSARKSAFSAPRIWIVEAGSFERFVRPPEWVSSLAPSWVRGRVRSLR